MKKDYTYYIDTHSHLFSKEFNEDAEYVVKRALRARVTKIILPAIDSDSHADLIGMVKKHPNCCFAAIGVHPTSIDSLVKMNRELSIVKDVLNNREIPIIGIGETGLDMYWNTNFIDLQIEAFKKHIELALKYNLPLIIHVRDAFEQTKQVISSYREKGLRGVFHGFSGDIDTYHFLKDCGDFKFGIGGVVTFKNSTLKQIVKEMPLEDIVLETDSPYLTPVPFRGKRNESSYIPLICEEIALIKGIDKSKVMSETSSNAESLFFI